jgi:hypothetical protein
VELAWRDGAYAGVVPAEYTQSHYPILYYFEIHEAGGGAMYPGFGPELSNQPYFLVRTSLDRRRGPTPAAN